MRSYLDELPSYDTVHIELSADDVPEVSFYLKFHNIFMKQVSITELTNEFVLMVILII